MRLGKRADEAGAFSAACASEGARIGGCQGYQAVATELDPAKGSRAAPKLQGPQPMPEGPTALSRRSYKHRAVLFQ
jgi:hypothetical protein